MFYCLNINNWNNSTIFIEIIGPSISHVQFPLPWFLLQMQFPIVTDIQVFTKDVKEHELHMTYSTVLGMPMHVR